MSKSKKKEASVSVRRTVRAFLALVKRKKKKRKGGQECIIGAREHIQYRDLP